MRCRRLGDRLRRERSSNAFLKAGFPAYISRPLHYSHTLNTGETVTVYETNFGGFGTLQNQWQTGSITVRGAYQNYSQYSGGGTMGNYGHYAPNKSWTSGVYSQPTMEVLNPAATTTNAPDATMFGYTASGKLSGTANTTGPITISVTPGQSYSFSGGNSYRFSGDQASPFSITSTDASVFLEY